MIFSDIREYLQTHQRATLSDMALHFRTEPDALRGMLDKWISKGRVRKLPGAAACSGGCCTCDLSATEIYEWNV